MTPFGHKIRKYRRDRGLSLKTMAYDIGVSAAYLSALEHGKRGTPTWTLVQRIITYFNIIWDEAEELVRLAQISDPRVVIETGGLSPEATELANHLARQISDLGLNEIVTLLGLLKQARTKPNRS
jgi:transcriptional regulator with XRE-family HTH domain